ncbi:hypothetical protein BCR42DRAFT_470190 [Absidia repens]|uniref:PH domain-containing protein n=1 Tax=Absidia repens TaxID=90262 RepID=A0A1X2I673_9FUNG|nr:hypothetical protein BCR42DRAFT_470190 [Absidia repens]
MISLFEAIKKHLPPIYCYSDDFQASTAKNYRNPAKDPSSLLEITPMTTALPSSPLKKIRKWQRKYDSLSQSTTHIVSQPVKSKKNNKDDDHPCLISTADKSMEELLPPYTCSVKKTGKMYIKREMEHHYRSSADRSWKKYDVHLHGTLLDAFTCNPVLTPEKRKRKSIILLQHGLQGAKVGWACDYEQKPYTLRIYSTITGEQVLLRPAADDHDNKTEQQEEKGLREMVEWIERIQAAINISMDIDEQKMPTFVTLARTHYRHHPNMATVILDQAKLAVQTCPHRGTHTSSITINGNNNKKATTKWRRGFKKW